MQRWAKLGGATLVLAFAVAAGAQDKDKDEKKKFTDEDFVKSVANANLAEAKLGEVGQIKGTDPRVKEFAKRMVIDHAEVSHELRSAAKVANVTVPEKMDAKHQEGVDRFQNYKGKSFDKDFMKHIADDHKKAVELFDQATKEAKNARLKAFATQTLPVIKEHRDLAKKIYDDLPGKEEKGK
jgi:putative membrane protein